MLKLNKQTISDALSFGFPTDRIKIRHNNSTLIVTRNQMNYDLDFLKKVLWIEDLRKNKQYWIDTRSIKSVEVTIISTSEDPTAKVGEI